MVPLVLSLASPLFSLMVLILACGLFNTFTSLRLELEGFAPNTIGLVVSASYLGILAGSLKSGLWIAKLGHSKALLIFTAAITLLVLGQSVWIDPWYWAVLRFFGGMFLAGIFVVIESWLLIQSPPQLRGKILSIYLAIFYASLSLGQFFINLSDPKSLFPFLLTAFICAVSMIPILFYKGNEPKLSEESSSSLSLAQLYRISPHGFMGGLISGMILAAIYGLGPIYAKEIGMSIPEIGTFMAVLIFGGLSLQWPMGHWADKGNRKKALNLSSFSTCAFAIAIAFLNPETPLFLLLLAWCFGGFAFTIYPLSMAYTCENLQESQIVSAAGGFVLSYGIGSIGGPLLAPLAMNYLGSSGLFYFVALISLSLALMGLLNRSEKTFP